VENTLHLRGALMRVFHTMKEHLDHNIAPHGTPTKGRCRVCEFNDICPERCWNSSVLQKSTQHFFSKWCPVTIVLPILTATEAES